MKGSQFAYICFPSFSLGKTVSTTSRPVPTTVEVVAGKIYKLFFLSNQKAGRVGKITLTSYLIH